MRVKRSFTERLSSFARRIFRRRRGSYDVSAIAVAEQTPFQPVSQSAGSNSPASQPTISAQSAVSQSLSHTQTTSKELLKNSMEEDYQEWPITVDEPADYCDQ